MIKKTITFTDDNSEEDEKLLTVTTEDFNLTGENILEVRAFNPNVLLTYDEVKELRNFLDDVLGDKTLDAQW